MRPPSARQQVAAFLALLVLVRGPFYVAAVVGGWGNDNVPLGMVVWAMLSAPPVLVVAMRWAERRSLRQAVRGLGWRPGPPGYLLAGWAAPIGAALAVYGTAWALGLAAPAPGRALHIGTLAGATVEMTLGIVIPTLLFEELAWRGFLVPRLAEFLPFGRVALYSGAVWALFHYPFLLWPTTAAGTAPVPPTLLSVGAFTAAAMAASVPLAWLRLRTGSVWPAVLFHAAHNAFAAGVLARALRPTGPAGAAVLGESGVGLALAYGAMAWWAWRHRGALPMPADPDRTPLATVQPGESGRRSGGARLRRAQQAAGAPRRVLAHLRSRARSGPQLLGGVLLAVGLGHLAYGLVQRAVAVSVAAYAVLATCTALGGWLVGRGGRQSRRLHV